MSENINLIPANELPVAEGDEVSVLCLENGELKQKPGASLGNNAGGITAVVFNTKDSLYNTSEGYYFVSYELYKKLMNNEPVIIILINGASSLYPVKHNIPSNPNPESEYGDCYGFTYENVAVLLFANDQAAFNYYDR